MERLVRQIVERRIDITREEEDWVRPACAFANEFGEEGREYFHAISQFYQEADKKVDHGLKGEESVIQIVTRNLGRFEIVDFVRISTSCSYRPKIRKLKESKGAYDR